jgi:hypothetical protein
MGLNDSQVLNTLQEAILINEEEGIPEANDFLKHAVKLVNN